MTKHARLKIGVPFFPCVVYTSLGPKKGACSYFIWLSSRLLTHPFVVWDATRQVPRCLFAAHRAQTVNCCFHRATRPDKLGNISSRRASFFQSGPSRDLHQEVNPMAETRQRNRRPACWNMRVGIGLKNTDKWTNDERSYEEPISDVTLLSKHARLQGSLKWSGSALSFPRLTPPHSPGPLRPGWAAHDPASASPPTTAAAASPPSRQPSLLGMPPAG